MEPTEQNSVPPTPSTSPALKITPTGANTEQKPTIPIITEQPIFQEIPPKPKSKILPVLIILLVFVVLGSLGYFAYQKFFAPTKKTLVEVTSTQVPTVNPTGNWKTYIGETVYTNDGSSRFSIQYPSDWLIKGNTLYPLGENPDKGIETTLVLGGSGREVEGNISTKIFPAGNANYLWEENTTQAYGFTSFPSNNIAYIFYFNNVPIEVSKEYEEIFSQILSTFKFMDQTTTTVSPTPVIIISNWKTYTNSDYGYSFKYPSNWGIGSICDGDKKENVVTRLGPHLLKFPNSDCGTANIPSTVMFYIKPQPPLPPENYSIVEQNIILKNNIELHYFEFSIVDRSQVGSANIFQFYIPLANQYLIAVTGSYLSATLKSEFKQIISTFKFTN